MKDGTTHLAYKAEHVVDLESDIILAAEVYHADQGDTHTLEDSVNHAQTNQREAGSEAQIQDVAADKKYHGADAQRWPAADHTTAASPSAATVAAGLPRAGRRCRSL